jgi:hypothetical protein
MIRTLANQYRGVNAHLHSLWQSAGGWDNFHNRHIGDLAGLMRQQLLPMGYTAAMEASLQIRRMGDPPQQPRADILISSPHRSAPARAGDASLTVADLLEVAEDTESPYRAVVISEQAGSPVAWVELLSPTNKGTGADAQTYRFKRRALLVGGLVFVEMDYLHETPPTFPLLADYTAGEQDAHPYRIAVLDPRPTMQAGPADPNEFDTDAPMPTVHIPLNAGNALDFDFGAAYQKTFMEMAYGLELVDYDELPLNFERYSLADQGRIAARMLAVRWAARAKVDLESAVPLPTEDIAPEAALEALKREGNS